MKKNSKEKKNIKLKKDLEKEHKKGNAQKVRLG